MGYKSLLLLSSVLIVVMNSIAQEFGTFTDTRDGRTYKTVIIGNQTWMAENLNYKAETGSWFYNNDSSIGAIYGRLYDWETALKVCPTGWHLPSDIEWTELADSLGNSKVGGKMKVPGTLYWKAPNTDATNVSGFSALPGGYRNTIGQFLYLGSFAMFYSSL